MCNCIPPVGILFDRSWLEWTDFIAGRFIGRTAHDAQDFSLLAPLLDPTNILDRTNHVPVLGDCPTTLERLKTLTDNSINVRPGK